MKLITFLHRSMTIETDEYAASVHFDGNVYLSRKGQLPIQFCSDEIERLYADSEFSQITLIVDKIVTGA